MDNRMTIRANNQQIFSSVIFFIAVYVMNSKNFFYFLISTFFTFFNNAFSLPKSPKITWAFRFINRNKSCFVGTYMRAIFSFFAWGVFKFFIAKCTNIYSCTKIKFNSRFVITFSRTIFSCIASGRNVLKIFSTYFTIRFNTHHRSQTQTFSRTIFKFLKSIFRDIFIFPTKQTFNEMEFHYAFT